MYSLKEIMDNWNSQKECGYDKAYDMMESNYFKSHKSEEWTLRYAILVGDGPFMDYKKSRKILLEKFVKLQDSPRYVILLYIFFYRIHYNTLSEEIISVIKYRIKDDASNAYRYNLCLSEYYSWQRFSGSGDNKVKDNEKKYALKSFNQQPTVDSSLKLFNYFSQKGDYKKAYSIVLEGLKSIKKTGETYENTDWTYYENYIDWHISKNSNQNCIEELKESLEYCTKKLAKPE